MKEKRVATFFVRLICLKEIFFTFVIYLDLTLNFQNIYTFTYQKTLFQTVFCLFLKSFKAFSVTFLNVLKL